MIEFVSVLLLLSSCTPRLHAATDRPRVIDGDTFEQRGVHWRLWGADALEHDQPGGTDARDSLASLLRLGPVSCDRRGRSYDRVVGRCLVYTPHRVIDIGAEQVRRGWAFDTPFSKGEYADEQTSARAQRLGLWSLSGVVHPYTWRKAREDQHSRR